MKKLPFKNFRKETKYNDKNYKHENRIIYHLQVKRAGCNPEYAISLTANDKGKRKIDKALNRFSIAEYELLGWVHAKVLQKDIVLEDDTCDGTCEYYSFMYKRTRIYITIV